jgi:hypothetical protein
MPHPLKKLGTHNQLSAFSIPPPPHRRPLVQGCSGSGSEQRTPLQHKRAVVPCLFLQFNSLCMTSCIHSICGFMQSCQLQGAPCCGITRGLYRDCSSSSHEVSFSIKLTPADFCVNEVSIRGVVADVSATPPCDETELPDVSADPGLGADEPVAPEDGRSQSVLGCTDAPFVTPPASDEPLHCAASVSAPDEPLHCAASVSAPAECGLEAVRSCFADASHWSRVHADLTAIAPTFFSTAKPHDLFAPELLLLSGAACNDKLLRKCAYNAVRAMFPFVSLTTPCPPG